MTVVRIGSATLYLGDSREIVPHIAHDVDDILADPPYGMRYRSRHNGHRKRGADAALARRDGNFKPIAGDDVPFDPAFLLELGKPTILWGANHFNDKLPPRCRWLVWNKLCGKTPVPSSSDIEMAWCSLPGVDRMFDHLWRGIMRAGEENIVNSAKLHPNQKPVALMMWCLGFLPGNGTVLDPFMGSGSAGVACMRMGRPFIGIESEKEYFDIAVARIRAEHEAREASPSFLTA